MYTQHIGGNYIIKGEVIFLPLRLSLTKCVYTCYRQDLPEGQLCRYFVYSRADFGVRSSLPNLTLIGWGVGVYGPQNWKKIRILPI